MEKESASYMTGREGGTVSPLQKEGASSIYEGDPRSLFVGASFGANPFPGSMKELIKDLGGLAISLYVSETLSPLQKEGVCLLSV